VCVLKLLHLYLDLNVVIFLGHQIVYYGHDRIWHIRNYGYFKNYVNICSYFDLSLPKSIVKYMFLVILITKKYIFSTTYYYKLTAPFVLHSKQLFWGY